MRRSARLHFGADGDGERAAGASARPVRSIRLRLPSAPDSSGSLAAGAATSVPNRIHNSVYSVHSSVHRNEHHGSNTCTHTSTPSSTGTSSPRQSSVFSTFANPTCPVCDKLIIGDADDVNEHIDDCINGRTGASSGEDEGGTPSSLFHRTTSMVNIDDDCGPGSAYGHAQYTDADVARVLGMPGGEAFTEADAQDQLQLNGLLQRILARQDPGEAQLRRLLRALMEQSSAPAKCAVCLEALRMPAAVSTVCWHVLCERCWLRQIGTAKSLCPQCTSIVGLSDLRKVFF